MFSPRKKNPIPVPSQRLRNRNKTSRHMSNTHQSPMTVTGFFTDIAFVVQTTVSRTPSLSPSLPHILHPLFLSHPSPSLPWLCFSSHIFLYYLYYCCPAQQFLCPSSFPGFCAHTQEPGNVANSFSLNLIISPLIHRPQTAAPTFKMHSSSSVLCSS